MSQTRIEVRTTEDLICLRAPYDMAAVCRAVKGATWHHEWRCWMWPKNRGVARALLDTFGSALVKADPERKIVGLADPEKPVERREVVDPGEIPGLKSSPWKHQREAWAFADQLYGVMLAMGMGTGKTCTSIALAHGKQLVLILSPLSVVDVWPSEFAKHAAKLPTIVPLRGTVARKKDAAAKAVSKARASGESLVVVVNYESAWREPLADCLTLVPWDLVILDECHRIKAPGGKASRFAARLRGVAKKVIGLTGTPMPHSPLDLYAQFRAIDPSVFGRNFAAFRQRYAIMGGFGGKEVKGFQNQGELHEKFMSITYKADRSVLSLPPATHTIIPVELCPSAMKTYRNLERNLYAEVEAGQVTAANALVKLLRLQQLTGGYLKLDDGAIQHLDSEKASVLQDLMSDMGEAPIVVFCRFRTDLDSVRIASETLGLSHGELSGRANDLASWQAGERQVLGVQIQSGGVGIDLTRANYCVYFSLGFSLGDYEQSLARVHRPGQTKSVSYYHLVAKDSIDQKVYAALESRKEVVQAILEGLHA